MIRDLAILPKGRKGEYESENIDNNSDTVHVMDETTQRSLLDELLRQEEREMNETASDSKKSLTGSGWKKGFFGGDKACLKDNSLSTRPPSTATKRVAFRENENDSEQHLSPSQTPLPNQQERSIPQPPQPQGASSSAPLTGNPKTGLAFTGTIVERFP